MQTHLSNKYSVGQMQVCMHAHLNWKVVVMICSSYHRACSGVCKKKTSIMLFTCNAEILGKT